MQAAVNPAFSCFTLLQIVPLIDSFSFLQADCAEWLCREAKSIAIPDCSALYKLHLCLVFGKVTKSERKQPLLVEKTSCCLFCTAVFMWKELPFSKRQSRLYSPFDFADGRMDYADPSPRPQERPRVCAAFRHRSRSAPQPHEAVRPCQGQEVREGSWSEKLPRFQGLGLCYLYHADEVTLSRRHCGLSHHLPHFCETSMLSRSWMLMPSFAFTWS